jgi:hypothetical protein
LFGCLNAVKEGDERTEARRKMAPLISSLCHLMLKIYYLADLKQQGKEIKIQKDESKEENGTSNIEPVPSKVKDILFG